MSKKKIKKDLRPEMDMNINPIWDILNGGELPQKNKKKIKKNPMDKEIEKIFSEIEQVEIVEIETEKPRKQKNKAKISWFQLILLLFTIGILSFTGFIFYKYDRLTISTTSMAESVKTDSHILYQDDLPINRFNVVVVEKNGKMDILRVIGMPGDSIKMTEDVLTINNSEYDEIYLKRNYLEFKAQDNNLKENYTANFDLTKIDEGNPDINNVPKSKYLLLGDNRIAANDSRKLGFYDASEIKGVALMNIWPYSEFGPIE